MSALEVRNLEIGLMLGFGSALAALWAYLFWLLYKLVRRAGYQSPFTKLAFCGAYFATIGLGGFIVSLQPDLCWDCTPAHDPEYFGPEGVWLHVGQFAWSFSAGMAMGLIATAIAVRFVPVRVRHGGRRQARLACATGRRQARFPWAAVGVLSLSAIPVVALLVIAVHLKLTVIYKLGVACFGLYVTCAYYANRQSNASSKASASDDPRPAVLYLRSFDREDNGFATPTKAECAEFGIPIRDPMTVRQKATVEEYLATSIVKRIGPFVALGDPYDYLPPAGADRVYLEDSEWQDAFLRMARASTCILIIPGLSENLRWELQSIRSEGEQMKLFALTPPLYPRLWGPIAAWYTRRNGRDWSAFRRVLDNCGYGTGDYPGEGAIVGFDKSGRMAVVRTKARTPGEYVAAIEERLSAVRGSRVAKSTRSVAVQELAETRLGC